MDKAFRDMLPFQITFQRYKGKDNYGNPEFAPPVFLPAFIETNVKSRPVIEEGGTRLQDRTVISTTILTDYVDPPLTPRDLLTLPDQKKPKIVDVSVGYEETGPSWLTITAEEGVDI